MKLRSLFSRAGFTASVALALVVGVATMGIAANINLSTGAHFVPTGPALFQGSDLNTVVDQVNTNTAAIAAGGSGAYTGTFNGIVGGITPAAGTFTTLGANATTVTSASANALTVGRLGATTPAFNIDASAGTSITGLNVAANSTGNGVALTALGATNEPMFVAGKGTGAVNIGGATTTLAGLQVAQTASAVNDLLVTNGATGTSVVLSANSAGADTNAGITMTVKGTGKVTLGSTTTCSGTTTATCATSQRFVASVTGLTTAAGGVSATAMTVTDTTVLSSSTLVLCSVNGYSGTGQPIVTNITPGTGTVSFQITNVAASGSLNATVPVACVVF